MFGVPFAASTHVISSLFRKGNKNTLHNLLFVFQVPLAYKHVVDRLGAASAAAAAGSAGDGSAAAALRALCGGGAADGERPRFRAVFWPWVGAWLGLALLQGSSSSKSGGLGVLSNARDLLWIPISQRAYKRIRWIGRHAKRGRVRLRRR